LNSIRAAEEVQACTWAMTITGTLVVNTYVGIWDTTPIVLSVIATAAVLKSVPKLKLFGPFTALWGLILLCSYVTTAIATATGVQLITVPLMAFGLLQLVAFQRLSSVGSTADSTLDSQQTPVPACAGIA
jgi:hypothetical protein